MSNSEDILYHYTDSAGLVGILTSKTIWSTLLPDMNDGEEDIYGARIFARYLYDVARNCEGEKSAFLKEVADNFSLAASGYFTYSHSLSSDPDSLSQWRGYTPKGGYCIGFYREALKRVAQRHGFHLGQCIYDEREQYQAVAKLFEPILAGVREWPVGDASGAQLRMQLQTLSQRIRCLLKHPSFHNEAEWRLYGHVSAPDPRSRWRTDGPYIKPYATLDFEIESLPNNKTGPIKEVWISPGVDFKRAQAALTHLMIGCGHAHFEIHKSKSPYRI